MRRSLFTDAPTPTPAPRRKPTTTSVDVDVSTEAPVEQLITRLSTDVRSMFSALNDRIHRLEQGLEQRISSKVAQILDKRINSERNRMRKDVDGHIERVTDAIKAEMAADIADINEKVSSISASSAHASPNIACNIVIRNLPKTANEITKNKVDGLIRKGCGLGNVSVALAERKNGIQGKPGLVIAKLKSVSDKKSVMLNKRKLKNSQRFSKVFIQHDQTKTDRLLADNFRTILAAVKNGDRNISLRGNRVVRASASADSRDSHQSRPRDSQQQSFRPSHDSREGSSRCAWNNDRKSSDWSSTSGDRHRNRRQ